MKFKSKYTETLKHLGELVDSILSVTRRKKPDILFYVQNLYYQKVQKSGLNGTIFCNMLDVLLEAVHKPALKDPQYRL